MTKKLYNTDQPPTSDAEIIEQAIRVLEIEARAITQQIDGLGTSFIQGVRWALACSGRVIVSGIGKSGHIARKFASTLSSTGTPAYFLHPAEAIHGDLGAITSNDIVIMISNSGTSAELLSILPIVKRVGAKTIAMTSQNNSPLAKNADLHIHISIEQEACPLNLAPTASTTATLAISDAFAISLLTARGFGPDDFARSHPGGHLGRRLLTRVSDIMHADSALPKVLDSTRVLDALVEITRGRLGMVVVVDQNNAIAGIFTDGDLRRLLAKTSDLSQITILETMTRSPHTILANRLAAESAQIMQTQRINHLLVIDDQKQLVGVIALHDLIHHQIV